MHFCGMKRAISQADLCDTFHFSPSAMAITLAQPCKFTNGLSNCDCRCLLNRANNFEIHSRRIKSSLAQKYQSLSINHLKDHRFEISIIEFGYLM